MSMVELQSCASLVNASSALRAMEQEVRGARVNVIEEISAELQREREKNAELLQRISLLEAQIQERDNNRDSSPITDGQDSYLNASERTLRKSKRQKVERSGDRTENGDVIKSKVEGNEKHDAQCMPATNANQEDHLVNWMSIDESQISHFDKSKDAEPAADCENSDDSEEDHEYCGEVSNNDHKDKESKDKLSSGNEPRKHIHECEFDKKVDVPCSESFYGGQSQIINEDNENDCMLFHMHMPPHFNRNDVWKEDKMEMEKIGGYETAAEVPAPGNILMDKKPPKVPFSPKEVKRILDSEALLLNNAQAHTIRKILVFASLGIRHGCEDMYELDFNHFSILRKGEPYVSAKNPGEHVLYENPGVRRKVFYPNRHNPILCPVKVLEEEKAMRPSDPNCPSCLFLCIKYGGRTRNLPQNEYVRQRMGRNKLKSFGPVMCRMALLVHIRSGSFFFKALGITLLFMAGFPDNMVQMETKYKNLDLLQKYYRRDEDAEGEELFLPHSTAYDTQGSPGVQHLTGKTTQAKPKGKKQANCTNNLLNLPRSSIQQSVRPSATPTAQFGLMGYNSIQNHAMAAFHSMQYQTPSDTPIISNPTITSSGTSISYQNQNPYHMFPPQAANSLVPVMYWPPPSAFPPGPYPATYSYQSFPSTSSYLPIHPHQFYSHPTCPFPPTMVENSGKNDVALEEANTDSDSSSSSTEPREA